MLVFRLMKTVINIIIGVVIGTTIAAMSAPNNSEIESTQKQQQQNPDERFRYDEGKAMQISYYRDTKSNICFARIIDNFRNINMIPVNCEAVKIVAIPMK